MTTDVFEINVETGETIERNFTPEEIAQREADAAELIARKAEEDAEMAARQAVLDRLGITEEEAQLILRGSR